MIYEIEMTEAREYSVLYRVEANSPEEAVDKALVDQTESKKDLECREVLYRTFWKMKET
jgi:hypothetical protein